MGRITKALLASAAATAVPSALMVMNQTMGLMPQLIC